MYRIKDDEFLSTYHNYTFYVRSIWEYECKELSFHHVNSSKRSSNLHSYEHLDSIVWMSDQSLEQAFRLHFAYQIKYVVVNLPVLTIFLFHNLIKWKSFVMHEQKIPMKTSNWLSIDRSLKKSNNNFSSNTVVTKLKSWHVFF